MQSVDDLIQKHGMGTVSAPSVSKAAANPNVVKLLNDILANEIVLIIKTLKLHWSVTGGSFIGLHDLSRTMLLAPDGLFLTADHVAERVRHLKEHPVGTIAQFLKQDVLIKEDVRPVIPMEQMVEDLVGAHEAIISLIQENSAKVLTEYKDPGTFELLNQTVLQHEKMAWLLRANIKGK